MKELHTEINKITTNPINYVYSWEAPERQWSEKDRSWYVVYSFFFIVLIAFLALLGEYVLILTVLAFVFFWFVQASVPPRTVEHIISNVGIKTFGHFYKWKEIKWFWFSKKDKDVFINFDIIDPTNPNSGFKKRITLLSKDNDTDIFTYLIKNLDYGNKEEVAFNPITYLLYGNYIELSHYLPEEDPSIALEEMRAEQAENKNAEE